MSSQLDVANPAAWPAPIIAGGLLMVAMAPPVRAFEECGNGVRDRFEQCDGADASACAAGCLPDCSCVPLCSPTPMTGCRQAARELVSQMASMASRSSDSNAS